MLLNNIMNASKICESLDKVIEHAWEREYPLFVERHELNGFSSQDTLEDFITMCEEQNLTNDIAYHVAILKHTLE